VTFYVNGKPAMTDAVAPYETTVPVMASTSDSLVIRARP
jgi:hypothetical protein